jgi:hypothetical protein
MKLSYYEGLRTAIKYAENIKVKKGSHAEHEKELILFYLCDLLAMMEETAPKAEEVPEVDGENGQR